MTKSRTSTQPWPTTPPSQDDVARFAGAKRMPFWLDALPERTHQLPLDGHTEADLCIVGGGFTGLWAALHAKRAAPGRDVVLLEAATIAYGASGRNGGFVSYSLTHGLANGCARFPDEIETLERLGVENFDGMRADVSEYGIDCGWEETGRIKIALEPHQDAWLVDAAAQAGRHGREVELLDRAALAARVGSPIYRGGLLWRDGHALVDPARLATGLLTAALRAGVRVYEHSPATGVERASRRRGGLTVATSAGAVRTRKLLLATSAFPPLRRRLSGYVVPVYDYALMTEPLTEAQREQIGWSGREGLSDLANQFHYYRQTSDHRVLFGGYDAVYRYGGPVSAVQDVNGSATFAKLSQHFATVFPQLSAVRFSHSWGGAIDTCSRFSVFFGTAMQGDLSYALGYTGLGVGAARFGAQVALDLLDGVRSEATTLRYVRRRPVPFPPEPARSAVIWLTCNRLAASDRNHGVRGAWLRALDRFGLGFDS